jgi:hypothetical protein
MLRYKDRCPSVVCKAVVSHFLPKEKEKRKKEIKYLQIGEFIAKLLLISKI